jgi:hypothetical protein
MRRRPGQPLVDRGEEEEALAELRETVDREFAVFAAEEGVAEPALWEIERVRCREDMAMWVKQEVEYFGDQVPVGCEVWFGYDEGSPVELPGRADILLGGRIDRVSRQGAEAAGAGLVLIDYKLGDATSGTSIEAGLDLQFPIYTIGVGHALPEEAAAVCGWYYWRLSRPVDAKAPVKPEKIAEVAGSLIPRIAECVGGIRSGQFPYDQVEKCLDYCASRDVCRREAWMRHRGSSDADADEGA